MCVGVDVDVGVVCRETCVRACACARARACVCVCVCVVCLPDPFTYMGLCGVDACVAFWRVSCVLAGCCGNLT